MNNNDLYDDYFDSKPLTKWQILKIVLINVSLGCLLCLAVHTHFKNTNSTIYKVVEYAK